MEKKNNNGMMVGLLMGIIIMLGVGIALFATGTIGFKTTTDNEQTSGNDYAKKSNTLSEQEAIAKGKELYEKTTKVYETWRLLPYCGERSNDEKIITFKSGSSMYESKYKNLEELKKYLATFLSDEIIDNHIKETAITDASILDTPGQAYTDYLIKDGKLYCRTNTGKGWISRYLNSYDLKVNTIKSDIIIYNVKLAYVNEYTASQTDSKCTYGSKISDCSENQIEYVDTKFIIQKINETWKVTDYVLNN